MYDEREELLKALRSNPVTLQTLVRGLTDAALRARPAPDEWSIVEVVAHLGDTEERTLERVRRMLDEDNPTLPGFDQAALGVERHYHDMDFGEALRRFLALRAEHLGLLESLDDAGWRRPGVHAENGPMSVQLYESHIAGEDADHMAQIARLVPA
ncbi:MAG TPA: DinB family protein [Candidatus Limnocylindria bacterium]|nr:DinB family protein [Candidatus Limnocylindria bacterium]